MKTAFLISVKTNGNGKPSLADARRLLKERLVGTYVDAAGRGDTDLLRIEKVTVTPIAEA